MDELIQVLNAATAELKKIDRSKLLAAPKGARDWSAFFTALAAFAQQIMAVLAIL
jgi:hypothetical protein